MTELEIVYLFGTKTNICHIVPSLNKFFCIQANETGALKFIHSHVSVVSVKVITLSIIHIISHL